MENRKSHHLPLHKAVRFSVGEQSIILKLAHNKQICVFFAATIITSSGTLHEYPKTLTVSCAFKCNTTLEKNMMCRPHEVVQQH